MRKILTLALATLFLTTAAPAIAADGTTRGITVSAIGQIKVTPDAANVSFTISLLRKTNAEALAAVSTVQAKARAVLTNAGVPKENITTTGLSIYPEYYYETGAKEPTLIGYRATQSTTAAIYSIAKAESVLDSLAAVSDDLRLSGISLFIGDPTKYEEKMRQIAVAKAKAKAAAYAKLLGRRLGPVQYLTETSAPVSSYSWERPIASADKVSIDPGQQSISISVEVRWSLR
jgi:uncharacterized protein YggE